MSEEIKIENNSILSGGYGLIPQIVARDKSISIGAKGLYSYLSSIAGAKGTCYPTRELITGELNINKNTFTKYLNELKESGYINVIRSRSKNGVMTKNTYEIIYDKSLIKSSPCPKKADMDKAPCPKFSDVDEHIENTTYEPCPKKADMDRTLEFQHSTPCPNLPDMVNADTNSNSININSKYVYKDEDIKTVDNNISEFKKLYEQNIGVIYPVKAQWLIELSKEIDIALFRRAIEICAENMSMTPAYLNGILKKWRDKNITSYEQLKAHELEYKNQQEAKKPKQSSYVAKKSKFHNFKENFNTGTEDELMEKIRRSQKDKFG